MSSKRILGGAITSAITSLDPRTVTQLQSARSDTTIVSSADNPVYTTSAVDDCIIERVPIAQNAINVGNFGANPLFSQVTNVTSDSAVWVRNNAGGNLFVETYPQVPLEVTNGTVLVDDAPVPVPLFVQNTEAAPVYVQNNTSTALYVQNSVVDAAVVPFPVVSSIDEPVIVVNQGTTPLWVQNTGTDALTIQNQGAEPLWVQNTGTDALTIQPISTLYGGMELVATDYDTGGARTTMGSSLSFGGATKTITFKQLAITAYLPQAPGLAVPNAFYQLRVYTMPSVSGYPLNDDFSFAVSFNQPNDFNGSGSGMVMLSLMEEPVTLTGQIFYFLLFKSTATQYATNDFASILGVNPISPVTNSAWLDMNYTEVA